MSWWKTSNISSLATQALKTAQKRIDKVLDIEDEEEGETSNISQEKTVKRETDEKEEKGDFWNNIFSSPTQTGSKTEEKEDAGRSSWSMPWGSFHEGASSGSSFTSKTLYSSDLPKPEKLSSSDVKKPSQSATVSDNVLLSDSSKGSKSSPAPSKGKSGGNDVERQGKKSSKASSLRNVSNVPHVRSKEKVENWDVSSEWQDETQNIDLSTTAITELSPFSVPETDVPLLQSEIKQTMLKPEIENVPEKETKLEEEKDRGEEKSDEQEESNTLQSTSSTSENETADVLKVTPEGVSEPSLSSSKNSSSVSVIEAISSVGVLSLSDSSRTDMTTKTDSSEELIVVETVQPSEVDKDQDEKQFSDDSDAVSKNLLLESSPLDDAKVDDANTCDINEVLEEEKHSEPNIPEISSERENVVEDTNIVEQANIPLSTTEPEVSNNENSEKDNQQEEESSYSNQPDLTDSFRNSVFSVGSPSASVASSVCSENSKLDVSLDTTTSDDTVVEQKAKISEEEEEEVVVENKELAQAVTHEKTPSPLTTNPEEEAKITESMHSESSSSSYVKCMIEEAMEDNGRMEDGYSDSHSMGGEKSECSRSTGGHDSGDEIDTTTSSDIEIISTPNSNGECPKMVDLSPLRISLHKTSQGTHRRTDSGQSTTSSYSREGQLSPGRDSCEDDVEDRRQDDSKLTTVSEETDPTSPKKLLQTVVETQEPSANVEPEANTQAPVSLSHSENSEQNSNLSKEKLIEKLAELTEVLTARENKILQLSKDNCDIMETNSILQSQLQQLEEMHSSRMEDVEKVSTEFTQRIGDSEKKINTVIREKEAVKKQLQQHQDDTTKRIKSLEKTLEEKEQQVKELLSEGEKLSKQQLQSNTIIKKLRSKEKENDTLLTSQKKKLDDQKTELDHLKKVLDSKNEMEKKQTDAINQLNSAVKKQEREMIKLKSELEDSQERVRGLQAALDGSYKELADLHKSHAAFGSKASEAALSVEMQVREEMKMTFEKEQQTFRQEKEALISQIEDFRISMSRMEKEHNRREDLLKQEISDLQQQIQEDEARNQELTHSVSTATRPLLRQIENLQATFAAQSNSWEKVEKNLTDRLVEAQTQLAGAVEKERSASEQLMELSAKCTAIETQNSSLRQEKSQLIAKVDMLNTRLEVLEDSKNSELAQTEILKQQMSQEISDIKKEKVFLETQLDMERTKLEQEKKKLQLSQEQVAHLEKELQKAALTRNESPRPPSRSESIGGWSDSAILNTSFSQDDIERGIFASPFSGFSPKTSLYESLRQSGAANLLENLTSQLKQREGEIAQLQSEIQQLERTRESMAKEMVNLSNQNEELEEKLEDLPHIKKELEDVNQRYNALLQMYGEKVEEADELRLDLQDVKDMYKMQIDHLLAK